MSPSPTIFALSSGQGRAGIAVIRISGPQAGRALDLMAAPRPKPRYVAFRRVRHPASAEILDEALVLWLPGPRTETGEDTAELQIHGGGAVIRATLLALATIPGCRLAEPGEFARRAFENGKLDLTAAEGLADLIDAETEGQRRQALTQATGALAHLYDGWRTSLIEARALTEAAIDFSDEADVATDALARAHALVPPLRAAVAAHLDGAHRGEIVREGFRVVLAGPPNVGKSSLMNALARREVAIVSPEAGTTRDVLETRLDLGGYAVVLADTAGLRTASGAIEAEGIRRAEARARDADLILWIVDATVPAGDTTPLPTLPPDRTLHVLNKIDSLTTSPCLTPTPPHHVVPASCRRHAFSTTAGTHDWLTPDRMIPVSAHTGQGLDALVIRITQEIERRLGNVPAIAPSQLRHRQGLVACIAALDHVLANPSADAELRAEDLRQAADALGRIVGRIDAEEVLDQVFSRFCIGK